MSSTSKDSGAYANTYTVDVVAGDHKHGDPFLRTAGFVPDDSDGFIDDIEADDKHPYLRTKIMVLDPGRVTAFKQCRGESMIKGPDGAKNHWWVQIEVFDQDDISNIGWISAAFVVGGENDDPVPDIPKATLNWS